jgi:hypothetical protein
MTTHILAGKKVVTIFLQVGFEVVMAHMKMVFFWDVVQCSLVEVYQRFRDTSCLHHQGKLNTLMMEVASIFEMPINFY